MLDEAQAYEERDRALALAAVRQPRPDAAGFLCCVDCGDEIPAARRQAAPGVRTCVTCQAKRERGTR